MTAPLLEHMPAFIQLQKSLTRYEPVLRLLSVSSAWLVSDLTTGLDQIAANFKLDANELSSGHAKLPSASKDRHKLLACIVKTVVEELSRMRILSESQFEERQNAAVEKLTNLNPNKMVGFRVPIPPFREIKWPNLRQFSHLSFLHPYRIVLHLLRYTESLLTTNNWGAGIGNCIFLLPREDIERLKDVPAQDADNELRKTRLRIISKSKEKENWFERDDTEVSPEDASLWLIAPTSIPISTHRVPITVDTELLLVQDFGHFHDSLASLAEIKRRIQDREPLVGRIGTAGRFKEYVPFLDPDGSEKRVICNYRIDNFSNFGELFDKIRLKLGLYRYGLDIDSLWFRPQETTHEHLTAANLIHARNRLFNGRTGVNKAQFYPLWAAGNGELGWAAATRAAESSEFDIHTLVFTLKIISSREPYPFHTLRERYKTRWL